MGAPVLQAARRLEYKALEAEISYALGQLFDTCLDTKEALGHLEDAVMAAEAARHEEVAIDAAAMLGSAYANLTRTICVPRGSGCGWRSRSRHASPAIRWYTRVSARVTPWFCGRRGTFGGAALAEEQRVLAIRLAELGPASVDVAMSNNNIAGILHELGRDQEAIVHIRRAIDVFVKALGEGNGRIALASVNECEILTALGRYDEAEKTIRGAIDIWESQEASSFYVGAALLDLGKAQLARGAPRGAAASFERSLTMLGTQDLNRTSDAQFSLAQALVVISRANLPRALELARNARDAFPGNASDALPRRIEAWQAANNPRKAASAGERL